MKQGNTKSKKHWLNNKEQIVPDRILLVTIIFILMLTLFSSMGQKAVMEQRIEMLPKHATYKL
jgi:hypothetical protein